MLLPSTPNPPARPARPVTLNESEILVLSAIIINDCKPGITADSTAIIATVGELTDIPPSANSIHTALRKLWERSLATRRFDQIVNPQFGYRRTLYRVTTKGRERLRTALVNYLRLFKALEPLLLRAGDYNNL